MIGAALATILASTASAASFPDYPLQTGVGSIPPNIVFIMDDSGSMGYEFMPSQTYPLNDNVTHRSYINNPMYYNPNIEYKAWMQADGTRMTGGTTYSSAFAHVDLASQPIDLANSKSCRTSRLNGTDREFCGGEQTFYVPKPGVTSPGTSDSNYHKYIIRQNLEVEKCERSGGNWTNCVPARPTGRTPEAERNNFATWYSYHRTRMKAAKAAASEAFSSLGENFRVGYDSIWNRSGLTAQNSDWPVLPIPVGSDDGLFRGTNKEDWFELLFDARNSGNTPLHGALQRAGQYYESDASDGPWGPGVPDTQLSCRQNFAILTTDGHWNNYTNYTDVGNSDGEEGEEIVSANQQRTYTYSPERPFTDSLADTLADVAMHYWKRDLRPDLANNVPSGSGSPAFWQHMTTYGISIGLKGTLAPEDVILIEQGSKSWPNPHTNSTTARIDDLLHAAVNSRGRFVAASNPQEFADALEDSLAAIAAVRSSGSNVASNGPSLTAGSRVFQATYTSGEWAGDLQAISIAGGLIAQEPVWSMRDRVLADPGAFEARPVFTWSGSSPTSFPTSSQRDSLRRNPGLPNEVSGATNANYIKGSRSGEGSGPNSLRRRTSPIGDIVNSSPFFVPETGAVFIGANDGMLHGVDADNGDTLFSYVPRGLDFSKLALLSSQEYQHHFFVDGGIDVTTKAHGKGRNILVASLGRGGKGAFGLDVTNVGVGAFSSSIVRWDRTFQAAGDPTYDADMGFVIGAPLVRQARTQSGNGSQTIAIVPNGIDSDSGKAVLFIYRLNQDGSISATTKIQLGTEGTAANPNGLAEARAADLNGDGIADYIYAGDLYGNLWRVDITGNPNQWDNGSNVRRLFTATDPAGARQPITAAVALALEPVTRRVFVLFGTGSYITNGDLTNTQVQSVYAVIDEDGKRYPISKSDLKQRTIPVVGVDSQGRAARAWEPYSELATSDRGWYVNLGVPSPTADGERVVTAPFMRGRAMWFSSIIPFPGDGCDSGGTGYLNAVDAFTGTNPRAEGGGTYSFIDVDGDGIGNDRIVGQGPDGEVGFVTSVDIGIGMPSQGLSVGNQIYACGSDAECGRLAIPAGGGGPNRLLWRELVDQE